MVLSHGELKKDIKAVQSFYYRKLRRIKMNVYDFDNTIYDGETFISLFMFLIKKDPSLIKYIPDVVSGLYKYTKGTINVDEALAEYGQLFSEYLSGIENLDELLSPDIFLFDILRRLNIKNYICSKTDDKAYITDLCFRGRKVELFREKFPEAEIDNFYTDSVNDTPMMEIAKHAFLVSGNRITQVK